MTELSDRFALPTISLAVLQPVTIYAGVIAIWLVYLFLSLYAPTNPTGNVYHLSSQFLATIKLSVIIPYLLMWLAAAYAIIRLERYTQFLDAEDGLAVAYIKSGVVVLLLALIFGTLAAAVRSFFSVHGWLLPWLTILTNYAYVFPFVIAFIYFYLGASLWLRQDPQVTIPTKAYLAYFSPLLLFAYFWLGLIFSNPTRMTAASASTSATYYLNDSLLVLTIVIPSLIGWIFGLGAVLKLHQFRRRVQGILYRQSLSSLVVGFFGIILASILLQALDSLGTHRLVDFSLVKLLAMVYLFLVIQGVGFLLVARGAQQLTRIETL